MKKIFSIITLFVSLFLFSAKAKNREPFIPGEASNRYVIGDSIRKFKETPWKCILIHPSGDSVIHYYRRNGIEKARINGSYFAAMHQDADNRDYYETYRTYKNGETKLVRNWYNYGADYNSKHNTKRYFYTPKYNDSHDNWVMAQGENIKKETYQRIMIYYDEAGYSQEEDEEIDKRIAALVTTVKEQENPFNPKNLAGSAFGLAAKALYILGLFLLFMLVFKRKQFYFWIDRHAGRVITPQSGGIFCKVQLAGIIPTLLILAPTGFYLSTGHSTAVITGGLIAETLCGIVGAVIYSIIYVMIRRKKTFIRTAVWEILYATASCFCLWATIILGIYVAVILLIVLFFAGMAFGKGGTISADESTDHAYITSADGDGSVINKISDNYYMDTSGNFYQGSGGSYYRIGDGKMFQ